jgi:pimeloyl-[acyl-carrier protein] methyl ester esterase
MTETKITLLLLPGLDGSGVMFRPLLPHLPSYIHPIIVNYPPDQLLGYDQLLPIVLAAIPGNSEVVVLGESFSGPLALMVAARCPASLRAVILCASFVRSPLRFRRDWLIHFVHPAAFRMYPAFLRTKAMFFSTSERQALKSEALKNLRPEVLAHRVRAVLKVDVRWALTACRVPLLYLRGRRDLLVPPHNLAEIRSLNPSTQLATILAPHEVLQSRPRAAASAIATFVQNLVP